MEHHYICRPVRSMWESPPDTYCIETAHFKDTSRPFGCPIPAQVPPLCLHPRLRLERIMQRARRWTSPDALPGA